ncbi:hypothetical protein [Pseudomonas paraeruginosa]|uniref:hypothetical protein n=3 Tax=Gammaproteobacteria TaxID=1236 RepID=UPI0037493E49
MSSTQHQLIEQCATRLRGIVEALDNIHDTSPQRWSTDLDDVHSSAESLLAMIKDQAPPSEDQLIAAGLSYPLAKEDAVKLWYAGFRSEVVTVLEAWEAIGHDTGINPDKEELLESLRNMAAICNAHGNDMPAQSAIDQRQVIADAITGALAFGAQASQPPAADHWLRPFYDIGRAEGQRTQDLAMLVRMLASSLKRHAPESNLVARATNYLAAKGLAGTPLRDPPAPVEQAGGDERAAFERAFTVQEGIYFDDKRGEYRSMNLRAIEATDAQDLNLRLQGWQARAALAQPSPVRSSLLINGYQLRAALDFIAPDGTAEQLESEACIEWRQQDADFLEAGLYAFCAEYPEEGGVLLDEEPTTAQPSPLQSEQAEAERPAVVGYRSMESGMVYEQDYGLKDPEALTTVAECDSIVGELRAEIAQLRQHKNDYMDAGQETYRALQNEIREREAEIARLDGLVSGRTAERDAALARVADMKTMADNYCALLMDANAKLAEMERQEPVALANRGLHAFWVKWTEAAAGLYGPGIKLYAAPVAQAQQLHDLDKQCRDDVARALGLRPNQERGFAWSYLLASIKSCVKASGDSAQAQHSVPIAPQLKRALGLVVAALEADGDRPTSKYALSELKKVLAAAPGKEVPQAWIDVQAERRRQIEAEGWTPEHDDAHSHGQMARAAACYALAGSSAPNDGTAALLVSLAWPWDEQWWKPSTARRDMVKACALALAEIERLDRAAASQGGPSDA